MIITYERKKNTWFFFLSGFSFTKIRKSSLPLPPASQTLRPSPGDYCRELTSACITTGEHKKKKILENNINVQKQPLEVFYKKTVLTGKDMSWVLFLIKLFQ